MINPIEIITPVVLMLWSFVMIFFFCEFGEMLTKQFNIYDEVLCQCNWYSYPFDIQKVLLIVMVNTQQPTILRGYANMFCSRGFFKQVSISVQLMSQIFQFERNHFFYLFLDRTRWIFVFYDASSSRISIN